MMGKNYSFAEIISMKEKHLTFLVRFLESQCEEEFKCKAKKYEENLNVTKFSEHGYIVEAKQDLESLTAWFSMNQKYSTFAGLGKEAPINFFGAYLSDSALPSNTVDTYPVKCVCEQ